MATYRELLARARDEIDEVSTPEAHALIGRRRCAALRRRQAPRGVGRGASAGRRPPAAQQPRVARRGTDPRQVASARRLLRERIALCVRDEDAPRARVRERRQPLGRLRRLEAERLRVHDADRAVARATDAVRAPPHDPRGRRRGSATAARLARPADRRRRARLARIAVPGRRGSGNARDHRRGRRRRLEPPATDRALDRTARRAEGRLREEDDRGAQPGRRASCRSRSG